MKKKYVLFVLCFFGFVFLMTGCSTAKDKLEDTYYAKIKVQDYGTILVKLDAGEAPLTVQNFKKLANDGFYDGLTFHRIIEGFMIQGGDPLGTGGGGSNQTIKGEFSKNGVTNTIKHVRGTISMARSEDYNSASSQFFIVQQASLHLDGAYAGFGTVLEGMEIVDQICQNVPVENDNGRVLKQNQPVITSIRVSKNQEDI